MSKLKIPDLKDKDLDALANDPEAFLSKSKNRAKLFGLPSADLKSKLKDYSDRNGIDPASMIKSVITEIEL